MTFFPKTGIALAVEDGATPATVDDAAPNVPVNLDGLVANGQVQNTVSYFGRRCAWSPFRPHTGRW